MGPHPEERTPQGDNAVTGVNQELWMWAQREDPPYPEDNEGLELALEKLRIMHVINSVLTRPHASSRQCWDDHRHDTAQEFVWWVSPGVWVRVLGRTLEIFSSNSSGWKQRTRQNQQQESCLLGKTESGFLSQLPHSFL